MPLLGDRLRAERERLRLSQQEIADVCGVTMRSQRNYEKGDRLPDADYLGKLDKAGGDVLYVLTGRRSATKVAEQAAADFDSALMTRIVKMLLETARGDGRTWEPGALARASVDIYEFLAQEDEVGDGTIERALKLVINR